MTAITLKQGLTQILSYLGQDKLDEANTLFTMHYSTFSNMGKRCEDLSRALARGQSLTMQQRIKAVQIIAQRYLPSAQPKKEESKINTTDAPPEIPESETIVNNQPKAAPVQPKPVRVKSILNSNIWSEDDPWAVFQRTGVDPILQASKKA